MKQTHISYYWFIITLILLDNSFVFILFIPPSIPWDYAMFMWEKCRTVELYTVYSIHGTGLLQSVVRGQGWRREQSQVRRRVKLRRRWVCSELSTGLREISQCSPCWKHLLVVLSAFLHIKKLLTTNLNRPKPSWPCPLQEDHQCWLVGSSNKEKARLHRHSWVIF